MANVVFRIFSEKLGATTASQFIGNAGEIFYDPDALSLRISDGVSPGGRLLVGSGAAGTVATDIAVTPTGGIQTSTVQAALQELDTEKLSKSGGIMTGELVLSNTAPVDPYAAVSRTFMQTYVANTISSGGVVANNVVFNNANTTLTSNTIQGAVAELAATKLSLSGGALTGAVTTTQTVFANNELVTKSYVESLISNEDTFIDTIAFSTANGIMTFVNTDGTIINVTMDGRYLPLSGGTMTGELILSNTAPTSNNSAATVNYVSNYVNNAFANGSVQANTITFNNSTTTTISSNTIQGAIAELDAEKVAKAGDTMTGFLTLSADPTANLHATTKQYVDNKISNTTITANNISYAPTGTLSANNVTAALTELDNEKVAKAGDSMTGFLSLYADPIAPLQAATKAYVDAKVTAGSGAKFLDDLLDVNATVPLDGQALVYDAALSRYILQNRVKNTGDTMTGLLTLSGDPTANLHAATKQYVDVSVANVVNSAPAALNTLNELANALGNDSNFSTTVTNNIAGKVAKAGDTMTGFLTLSADPTANLHAVTKQYVDGKIANTNISANNITYTPGGNISANNVTAALTELDTEKVAKAGDTMTGFLTLSADPTANLHATTKQYVDGKIANTVISANNISYTPTGDITSNTVTAAITELDNEKVAKAGGVMTGSLTLSGDPTANLHAATKQYVDGKTYTLSGLTDTANVATASNGQVLAYSNTAGKWVPFTLPAGTTDTYITSGSMDGDGNLTLSRNDGNTVSISMSSDFVLVAGDTMTGRLTLSGNPTANLHAATKEYVDTKSYPINSLSDVDTATSPASNGQVLSWDGTNWVPTSLPAGTTDTYVTSGSMDGDGNLTLSRNDGNTVSISMSSDFVLVAGDTMTGALTLFGAPTANLHAATKEYVDTKTYTLAGLTDTANVATASDGQILTYSSTASKWVPTTPAAGGDVSSPSTVTSGTLAYFNSATGKVITGASGFIFSGNTIMAAAGEAFSSYQVITRTSAANGIGLTSPTLSWDYSYHKRTITSATTFAFANPTIGTMAVNDAWSMTIELTVNGGSVTWPASIKWPGGTAPTLTNAKTHLIMLVTSDGGTTVYGSSIRDY